MYPLTDPLCLTSLQGKRVPLKSPEFENVFLLLKTLVTGAAYPFAPNTAGTLGAILFSQITVGKPAITKYSIDLVLHKAFISTFLMVSLSAQLTSLFAS